MAAVMTYRIKWKALEGQESHPELGNPGEIRRGKFGARAYYGKTGGHTDEFFSLETATEMVKNLNVEYNGKIHHWMEDKLSYEIAYLKSALEWDMSKWEMIKDKPDVPLNHGSCIGCLRGDCESIAEEKAFLLREIDRYTRELKELTGN